MGSNDDDEKGAVTIAGNSNLLYTRSLFVISLGLKSTITLSFSSSLACSLFHFLCVKLMNLFNGITLIVLNLAQKSCSWKSGLFLGASSDDCQRQKHKKCTR